MTTDRWVCADCLWRWNFRIEVYGLYTHPPRCPDCHALMLRDSA